MCVFQVSNMGHWTWQQVAFCISSDPLNSFLVGSLLAFRKDIEIYSQNFIPCYFAETIIWSKDFLVEFSGSFKYRIIWSANRDTLISFLFAYFLFLFLLLQIRLGALYWISGENGHFHLIVDSTRNAFHPLSMMLSIYHLFNVELCSL